MKIRTPDKEMQPKVSALLRLVFGDSSIEGSLFSSHSPLHEWVCIHKNKIIAYIAFSNAYDGDNVCGLHLAPLAVNPEYQGQGVGSELVRFSLRQEPIRENTIFVKGNPAYFNRFGFEKCTTPVCPFDRNNRHFMAIRNNTSKQFTIGYEPWLHIH